MPVAKAADSGFGPGLYPDEEVIFEFLRVGNAIKVTAVHPATFTEVSIVGSPHSTVETLEGVALRKLRYVLAKRFPTR